MKKKDAFRILFVILIAAAFLAPLASTWPDGLERIAKNLGFAEKEKSILQAPFAGYRFPGVENELLSTALVAVLAGIALCAMVWGIAAALRKSGNPGKNKSEHPCR